ncbi:MAG: response regulator [Candidatus Lokiarchaeota archaeon]|nr:response regulator [Candidatus Lokiarchaeota archaeon]MBD3201313.1 response regulator [Candidatus Lokiarchaeota archaeon]
MVIKKMKTVFIVEDDPSLRTLYQKVLLLHEIDVIGTAKNGIEAVQIYKELYNKIDLILMDFKMPGKNGLEASKEILNFNKNASIIMLSSSAEAEKEALLIGVKKFYSKPSNLFDFVKIVKEN